MGTLRAATRPDPDRPLRPSCPSTPGVHEWFLWKLVLTPLASVLPTEYSSIDLLKKLTEVMTPDWSVLRGVKERLSFTWVR
jgi:hypothetical protein